MTRNDGDPALVEGEARLAWTIDGVADDVSVPARLRPADVLSAPAETASLDDPPPAFSSR